MMIWRKTLVEGDIVIQLGRKELEFMGMLNPRISPVMGRYCRSIATVTPRRYDWGWWRVSSLTIFLLLLSGCSLFERHHPTSCKSHAYIKVAVENYIRNNYSKPDTVRAVVLPFFAPLNLKPARFDQVPESFGSEIARIVHAQLLESRIFPIVEISFNGPRTAPFSDFFGGNHEVMEWARTQGYDLIVIGQVEQFTTLTEMAITSKVIDVTKGVTLWYGHGKTSAKKSTLPEYRLLTEDGVRCLFSSLLQYVDD